MNSTKPSLLIITDWYLPGYQAGGPIRSISHLAKALYQDFDIHIVCRDRDYLQIVPYSNIEVNVWAESDGVKVMYLSPENQSYRSLKEIIRKLPEANTVYINGIFSVVFSIQSLWAAKAHKRSVIIAPRGMLAPDALSLKSYKKETFLWMMRTIGMYRKVSFHATSEVEAQHISTVLGVDKKEIHLIPNMPGIGSVYQRSPKQKGKLRLLQVARIAAEKNNLFAIELLKNIPSEIEILFKIVGPVYDQAYFELCQMAAESLPHNVKIVFSGSRSPVEIEMLYPEMDLMFLPTLGENYGHAIIDAMLNGCPVLISDRTPWQNLAETRLGQELNLSDSDRFIEFICTLASMDEASYLDSYTGIADRAASLVNRPGLIQSYKALFHVEG